MAREEADREDLLREAKALIQRIELRVSGVDQEVVAGFRRDGCGSVYFGPDPAYHFNSAGQLRRAYVGGDLWKAEQGRLIVLHRRRTGDEVQLLRVEPTADDTAKRLAQARQQLAQLQAALAAGTFDIAGQVPADAQVERRLLDWLTRLVAQPLALAPSPHAR